MCVLYVSFRSKVRHRTIGCIVGSVLLFIVRSRLLVYSVGYGMNRVQVVLSGFSMRFLARQKLYVSMVVCIYWLHSCLCVWR